MRANLLVHATTVTSSMEVASLHASIYPLKEKVYSVPAVKPVKTASSLNVPVALDASVVLGVDQPSVVPVALLSETLLAAKPVIVIVSVAVDEALTPVTFGAIVSKQMSL